MTIQDLYQNYHPDEAAIAILRTVNIVLLAGISGAGKDTLQSRLVANPDYHKIVTHTTRRPRTNDGVMEQDGREYHFVTVEQMADLLKNHQMIEINEYAGNYYGTSVSEFKAAKEAGKVAISNIDVNGITAFRELAGDAVRPLFIVPPDYETWRGRLSSRYVTDAEFAEKFPARRTESIKELEHVLSVDYYDFVINDDLDRAVGVVDKIAHRDNTISHRDRGAREMTEKLLAAIRADK